jgi:alpha-glucoside transport system substrate-binding protein
VEVLGVWGSEELDSFQAMVAPWEQQTGGKMSFTGTRDLTAILTTRIQANNPPDIAILPNPGLMAELAKAGNLIPLNTFLDMVKINQEYAKGWVDLGTVNGNLYSIFMKASDKGTVWYSPKVFADNGWEIPKTWDDMIALSDKIVAADTVPAAPWSIAVESGQASGWPATDWMAEILLRKYGGDVYDALVNHTIAWTDPKVKDMWEVFGKVALTPGYVPGGATAILATNFQDGTYLPFQTPPKAAMDYLGDFTAGFISTQFPDLVPGEDYSFFPFPTITPDFSGGVTGGADLVAVFKDTPTVRSFVEYLASADAQTIWVKRGGFTSVNNKVSLSAYPDVLTRAAAEQLTGATLFRFGAGDSMPSAVQTAWWAGVLSYLQDPSQLDSILENIESVAQTAYQ